MSSDATSSGARRVKQVLKLDLKELQIMRTLGTGSFGRVHLVKRIGQDQFYAMKVLKKSRVVKEKQVEHTINERNTLARVEHPFCVNLVATIQDSSYLMMILEYVPGGELFTYLRKSGRFPNNTARFYAAQVFDAFAYLHQMNIIYRDLKPENLLIDQKGYLKITDFGFAKIVTENVTWTLCGTPDYLAPEIIQAKGYGRAVDWYALGVLIYEMVVGTTPFFDEDHMKMYEKILASRPKYPNHMDSDAKDLLRHLLTPDLTKRYGHLKNGPDDIRNHRWFREVDWVKLVGKEYPAPYLPPVKAGGDSSNFDHYEEDPEEKLGATGPDPYRDKFKDF